MNARRFISEHGIVDTDLYRRFHSWRKRLLTTIACVYNVVIAAAIIIVIISFIAYVANEESSMKSTPSISPSGSKTEIDSTRGRKQKKSLPLEINKIAGITVEK